MNKEIASIRIDMQNVKDMLKHIFCQSFQTVETGSGCKVIVHNVKTFTFRNAHYYY